jgi:hypothetical protein
LARAQVMSQPVFGPNCEAFHAESLVEIGKKLCRQEMDDSDP